MDEFFITDNLPDDFGDTCLDEEILILAPRLIEIIMAKLNKPEVKEIHGEDCGN